MNETKSTVVAFCLMAFFIAGLYVLSDKEGFRNGAYRARSYSSLKSPDFGSTDPNVLLAETASEPVPMNIDQLVKYASGEAVPDKTLTRSEVGHLIRHLRGISTKEDGKSRLQYEKTATVRSSRQSAKTQEQLDYIEEQDQYGSYRNAALTRLHNSEAALFVLRTGSGFERHQPPGVEYLEFENATLIPADEAVMVAGGSKVRLPDEPNRSAFADGGYNGIQSRYEQWLEENNPLELPGVPRLTNMHIKSRHDFAVARSGDSVQTSEGIRRVGFDRHAITRPVTPRVISPYTEFQSYSYQSDTERLAAEPVRKRWHLSQMHLVSLLRHAEPRAYVSYYLPSMEDLEDKPTRELTRFESDALDKLYNGEDIVTGARENRIVMLGSLRATRDCLACHDVKRGDLLGAFSYRLDRVNPIPASPDQKVTRR